MALACTGLMEIPASPLLPVAPSSSKVSTDSTKFTSFKYGSAYAAACSVATRGVDGEKGFKVRVSVVALAA